MANYQHVLATVDLSEESEEVFARAKSLAANNHAKLSLLHVVEPLTFAYGGDIPIDLSDIQQQLHEQAEKHLKALAQASEPPCEDTHIAVGQPTEVIHRMAKELGVDVVVVGSHGRSGLALLLGSTANGVLHGAKCDVLAVRVND